MDSGISWGDQWDNNPASNKDKKKGKDGSGKNKFGKTMLSFKWVKELRKKTQK
ncbi:hypothetical protein JHK84_048913 [Glycine max]|uniref:Uncharacterized protein n=1 Tax=Glycine soja TaxID=3848 RepID=A0A0B2QVL9_GLYSO|nr:uncharacterized protein LOC114395630 [Glycine soja]KAG5093325.1 hypothetical protein JHK84_048913 [Glycine max]KHN24099.1 hypothetical protein glysoja_025272 [Glycine soja]RZB50088.1 hypothetical protein D0Y65_047164 [Glycine soja]